MKTNPPEWFRLVTVARRAVDDRDVSAPYGFATRVVTQAMAATRPAADLLIERFSWRALGIAALLVIVSVAANLNPILASHEDDDAAALGDPVGEVISLS